MGGADEPHVHLDGHRVADPLDLPLLDDPQELHLHGRGDVPDLVEQQRPAVGLLEAAAAIPQGAGEGALHVPEQLALEEVLVQRRAGDPDERPRGAPRAAVDRLGDALLAGTALPQDHHGGVGVGDQADGLEELRHRRMATDDAAEVGLPANGRAPVAARLEAFLADLGEALQRPGELALGVVQGYRVLHDEQETAVLRAERAGLRGSPLLGQPAPERTHSARATPDGVAGQDGAVPAQGLLRRPAGDALGGPVPEGHAAVEVDGEQGVGKRVGEGAHGRLAPESEIGDVRGRGDRGHHERSSQEGRSGFTAER